MSGERRIARREAAPTGSGCAADAVLAVLSVALEVHDDYTRRHSSAAVVLSRKVGERLGLDDVALAELARVAALHDVGKLGVPAEIVRKPGPLTEEEWAVMREHSAIGERILRAVPDLAGVARAVRHGHERWDGRGYPDHLVGREIPLMSRIVCVCDAFDAMTSDRPYRPAMDREAAFEELREGAGTQFDAQVVRSLLTMLGGEVHVSRSAHEGRERTLALAGHPRAARRDLRRGRPQNGLLAEQPNIDALTGVVSRAAWEETLAVEELHLGRSGVASSLVVIGVDDVKLLDDSEDDAAGDALLRACAALLADNTRAVDIVARIGSETFGALLRYTSEHEAAAWRERLLARLQTLAPCTVAGHKLVIWVGFAESSSDVTIADALAQANRRMGADRLAGRRARAGV